MPEKKNMAKQQETAKEKAVIYLGPAIAGIVSPGTVFNNGYPVLLQEAMKEHPQIGKLLVNVSRTAQARKELKDRTSARAVCYAKLVEEFEKKGTKK